VPVFLVRHAHAGRRSAWSGDDQLRPLSPRGASQARGVADLLADRGIVRVAASPATRCVETVEPLADRLGFEVEVDKRLAEGGDPADLIELVLTAGEPVSLCGHGDLIPEVIAALVSSGMKAGDPNRCQKGSVWEIEVAGGRPVRGRYHAPRTASR
jgi:phosphohistidine phosphatase SixA